MSQAEDRTALFWRLVRERIEDGTLIRGTIMGRPCVRRGEEFVAMPHSKTGGLVAKLDEARVRELIAAGAGEAFAPAGRVFKEWLLVPDADEARWEGLIHEAVERAGG